MIDCKTYSLRQTAVSKLCVGTNLHQRTKMYKLGNRSLF